MSHRLLSHLKFHLPKLPHLKANIWITAVITILSVFLISTILSSFGILPQTKVSFNSSLAGDPCPEDVICPDEVTIYGTPFYGGAGGSGNIGGNINTQLKETKDGGAKGGGTGGSRTTTKKTCEEISTEIQTIKNILSNENNDGYLWWINISKLRDLGKDFTAKKCVSEENIDMKKLSCNDLVTEAEYLYAELSGIVTLVFKKIEPDSPSFGWDRRSITVIINGVVTDIPIISALPRHLEQVLHLINDQSYPLTNLIKDHLLDILEDYTDLQQKFAINGCPLSAEFQRIDRFFAGR